MSRGVMDVQIFTPGWVIWQVVTAGWVIAVDIMWVREQPVHCCKEDNGCIIPGVGCPWRLFESSRSPGVWCRECRSHRLRPQQPLRPVPLCSHDSLSRTNLEANAVSTEIRGLGRAEGGAECQSAAMVLNRKHYSGSTNSRWYTSLMFIHREPCWAEIALDASALPSTLAAWSKPANLLLNALDSF